MKRLMSTTSLLLAVMLVLTFTIPIAAASNLTPSVRQSEAQGDGAGRDVVLSDLPDLTPAQAAGAKASLFPRNPHFSGPVPHGTVAARTQGGANTMPAKSPGGEGPLTASTFVDVLGQSEGCNGAGWTPSDMGLAVSATYVVQAVNQCVTVYNKSGGVVAGPKDLCSIFGITPNSGSFGCADPRLLYDAQANKFVLTATYQNASGTGYILIGAASNPTLAWHTHQLNQGAVIADYPTVGQTAYLNNKSNSVITVCYNDFPNSGGFAGAVCSFLPKKGVYGTLGSYPVWLGFTIGSYLVDTLQPSNSYELSDNPRAQYLINAFNDGGALNVCGRGNGTEEGVEVWAFSGNTAGQSTFSAAYTGCGSTSQYSEPGAADDANFCFGCIETLDNRISGTVPYSQGKLFLSIDAYNGYSSAVLGWRIAPYLDDNGLNCTGGVTCPALTAVAVEKEFCDACGAGSFFESYFGAIATTPENDWTLFATQSGSGTNTSPGQFYVTNRVSLLNPIHDGGIYYCLNNANYGQGRWGDYAAAAADDPGAGKLAATWGSGMYTQSNGNWGTCIAGVRPQSAP